MIKFTCKTILKAEYLLYYMDALIRSTHYVPATSYLTQFSYQLHNIDIIIVLILKIR